MNGNKYLNSLKDFLLKELEAQNVKVLLFGSRSRGTPYAASDIDIGIISAKNEQNFFLADLREKVEELNIPYKVDIVDLTEVSEDFRKEVLKDAILWKDYN